MSVISLFSNPRNHFEEQKERLALADSVSESSSSPTISTPSPSPIHFLKGGFLERYQSLFVKAYTYKAKLEPKIGAPVNLKFQFPLIPYLQECVRALQAKNIKVKRVLLKGGVVHRILTNSQKPLSDLDVTIEIERCKNWGTIERLLFEPLSDMADIRWGKDQLSSQGILRTYYQGGNRLITTKVKQKSPNTLFFTKGAKNKSKVVNDGTNEFGLYTIPALYNGNDQDVDVQVCVKNTNSCFCSLDSIQINLGDLDHLGENPYFEVAEGYDLQESLDLMAAGKFRADPEKMATLREGPRGFCRIFTKGYYPDDMNYEKPMWESYLKDHHRSRFKPALESYLKEHYSKDRTGKIFFLLNYYEMFSRCPVEIKEKESLEKIILEQLYNATGIDFPNEMQHAFDEIEAIKAYYYLRTNAKVLFGQKQTYAFLKTQSHDHLFFRSQTSHFETLLEKIEKNIDQYQLLRHLATDTSDLLKFFRKRMKKKEIFDPPLSLTPVEAPQTLMNQIEDPHFSIPDLQSKEFRDFSSDVQREIFFLLKNKRVIDAYKIILWALEQKGVLDSYTLQWIFKTFCSIGSMGMAEKLFKHLVQRREPLLSLYLNIFFENIAEQSHAQKFLELMALVNVDAEPLLGPLLQKYPLLIPSAMPFLQNSSSAFHRNLGFELIKTGEKQPVFLYFETALRWIGTSLFVDEKGTLLLDSIKFYFERLIAKNQWGQLIDEYKKLEPFVLQSDSFAEVYKTFLLAACSVQSPEAITLICNGLKELLKRGSIDNPTLSALGLLAKYPQVVEQTGPLFTQIQALVGKLPINDEIRKNEIARVLNAKPKSDLDIHRIGKQLYEAEKYKEALVEFKKIKNPSAKVLFHRIFPCYLELKNIEEALKTVQKAIEKEPEDQEFWGSYYLICKENSKMPLFFQSLEQMCKKFPKNRIIREIYLKYEETESSLQIDPAKLKRRGELYLECHEIDKRKNSLWINNYGSTCVALGNYKEAIKAFKETIEIDPTSVEPRKNLACSYSLSGNPLEAIKVLEKLIQNIQGDPNLNHETANSYAYMAGQYKVLNQSEKAEECYKKALNMRINKLDHPMTVKYAHTLYCMGNVDDAIKCLECSLLNQTVGMGHPREQFASDYYRLAQYYALSSQPELAAGAYEQAKRATFEVPPSEYASAIRARLKKNLELLNHEQKEVTRNDLKKVIDTDRKFLVDHLIGIKEDS